MSPDFIIIPYQIYENRKLTPVDGYLYGVIYWLERLKDGKCTASNKTLAGIMHITPGSVQNSMIRLEAQGCIIRIFRDKKRKLRSEIKCLVRYEKVSSYDGTIPSVDGTKVSSYDDHISKGNSNSKESNGTNVNGEEFFTDTTIQETVIQWLINRNMPERIAREEITKFISYWTEPNRTGKKVRWQAQQFFNVRRRLATWISNIKKQSSRPQSGPTANRVIKI